MNGVVPAPGAAEAPLLGDRALRVLLISAPALGVAEEVMSPLAGTTTRADLALIAVHQGIFVASVLVGVLATTLYIPAFLGLAARVAPAAPKTARIAAALVIVTFSGFMAVRAGQAVELQTVRSHGLALDTGAHLVDGTFVGPIGAPMLVMFLGGSILALAFLAAATWRAGLPRAAACALGVFPVLDLVLPGRVGSIIAHLVLLAATTTIALALGRPERQPAPEAVPSAA